MAATNKQEIVDVLIVGGGPTGLSCGIEARAAGLSYHILEKGALTDSIRCFPRSMTFFSTPELLELGDLPFACVETRPNRNEVLVYYRRVVDYFNLNISLRCKVLGIRRVGDLFEVESSNGIFTARNVVLATGYFDNTNMLGVAGEDQAHVRAYYEEPYEYTRARVCVIGGRNSAVETALELFRNGADVTLVHRGADLGSSVKYWIMPDIRNRIAKGEIKALFNTVVQEIGAKTITLRNSVDGSVGTIAADYVIKHIGYRPDEQLLRSSGVALDDETLVPTYNPDNFETNVPGLYVAGSVVCGCETWNIFIENGRKHARPIIERIAAGSR